MHIPDGYLSPHTCAAMSAAMLPVWATAAWKVKQTLKNRQIPLMAIGTAFCFTIMMYNLPIPGGTTGHAVGGGLLAIVLGPWAACIGVSIALAVQALLFGDGGILAFGANAFNMAFLMPFSAYFIYRLVAANSEATSSRRWIGGFVAGFISLNLAALATAVELGLQPALFHAVDGTPLFCPYPLNVAVPAMAVAHLAIAGPIEGIITALAVRYLYAGNSGLLSTESPVLLETQGYKKLWGWVGALVLLSPLGLLASGTAWGEWAMEEIKEQLGYIPQGMAGLSEIWSAPLPDYVLPGFDRTFFQLSITYIASAALGLLAITLLTHFFGQVQRKVGES